MKRKLLSIMAVAIIISGCASSGTSTGTKDDSTIESTNTADDITAESADTADDKAAAEEKQKENIVAVGDTITTEYAEIKINNVAISYEVLPDDTSSYYNYYSAESGYVYIDLDVDVKNLQKQDMMCDAVMTATADYNNGYKYTASPIVDDSTLGFTYANIVSIAPLTTQGMHYAFNCPQEIDETDYPLFVEIAPAGTDEVYKLVIR